MAKILLVDDDAEIAKMAKVWFAPNYSVDTAANICDARASIQTSTYDVIIVDLGLPDGDGQQFVKEFRGNGGITPILVLTGRSDINSKVDLLDVGADDYLTKPFHYKELEARIRSLLRRPRDIMPQVLEAGKISLNLTSAKVSKQGVEIALTPKEFALLEFFMRHPNQTFTQETLMQRVWPNDSDASPDIVRVYITRLRKKLESEGDEPVIHNQRGHGYIFHA